jgi:hypothetical protein
MRCITVILILAVAIACESNRRPPADQARIAAAGAFTSHYTDHGLASWKIQGYATGHDCGVLVVETSIIMEASMVEALHYGAGAYDIYKGGVEQFSRQRSFRGVVYKDSTGRVWRYGEVSASEVAALTPCR